MKLFSPSAKRLSAGLALIVLIAVVVAIILLTRSPGSSNASAQDSNAAGAATVQRRDLVETDTESGTLSYAGTQTVYNRLSGTITWLPNVGQVIQPGQALFRIDNQPIILMRGSTPAYRDLSASDVQGPDVLELNRNLIALGFNPDGIVEDDVWQAATTDGVEQFQASLGETETGILTLGRVVFLPGAQLIGTVDGTVGSTGGGGGSSTTGTAYDSSGPHTEFVGLTTTTQTSTTPTTTTPTTTTPTTTSPKHHDHSHKPGHKGHRGHKGGKSLANLVAQLQAEIQHLESQHSSNPNSPSRTNSPHKSSPSHKSSPNHSGSTNPSSSAGGGSATEILQTSSTHLVVTVDLAASSQSEAVRGDRVTVEMPNNTTVNGVITQVSKVAQTSSSNNSGAGAGGGGAGGNGSSGSSATIPVTIRLTGHVTGAGLDQAPVSVNFAQAKAKNVLSVPVTALVATAGGHYAVQAAAAPHKLIPVQTGLFAAGYVAISGPGVYQGLQVTDSQG